MKLFSDKEAMFLLEAMDLWELDHVVENHTGIEANNTAKDIAFREKIRRKLHKYLEKDDE